MAYRTNTLQISNVLTLDQSHLNEETLSGLRFKFTYPNPKHEQNSRLGFSNYATPQSIELFNEDAESISFPRGLIKEVAELVPNLRIDDRTISKPVDIPDSKITLRDYQAEAVEKLQSKNQGVLDAVVASGKTVMVCELIARLKQKTLILCHTRDLKAQWQDRVKTFLGVDAGLIDDQNFDYSKPVTIGMIQSLNSKRLTEDFKNAFAFVCLDEAHHSPAFSFERIISMFPAKHRYGCTGTVERRDGLTFVLHAVMGPVIHTVTKEDVLGAGQIIQPKIKAVMTDCYLPACDDYRTLIDAVVSDADRNHLILKHLISEAGDGHSCLVLSERISHLEDLFLIFRTLEAGVRSEILTGKVPKAERKRILNDADEGRVKVIFATKLADEGLDVPRLDRLFLTCPVRSAGKVKQQVGRIMRTFPGKRDAVVYDFIDRNIGLARSQWLTRKREAYADFEIEVIEHAA